MSNGDKIIRREVGEIITELDLANSIKGCDMGPVVKRGLKLSLRLGENSLSLMRINLGLLVVVIGLVAKVDGKGLLDFIISIVK